MGESEDEPYIPQRKRIADDTLLGMLKKEEWKRKEVRVFHRRVSREGVQTRVVRIAVIYLYSHASSQVIYQILRTRVFIGCKQAATMVILI